MTSDTLLIGAFCLMAAYMIGLTIKARRRSIERRLGNLERQVRQKR